MCFTQLLLLHYLFILCHLTCITFWPLQPCRLLGSIVFFSSVSPWDEATATVRSPGILLRVFQVPIIGEKAWRKLLRMLFGGEFPCGEWQRENGLSVCLELVVESWESPKPIFREERGRSGRRYLWTLGASNHSIEFLKGDFNQNFSVSSQSPEPKYQKKGHSASYCKSMCATRVGLKRWISTEMEEKWSRCLCHLHNCCNVGWYFTGISFPPPPNKMNVWFNYFNKSAPNIFHANFCFVMPSSCGHRATKRRKRKTCMHTICTQPSKRT